MFGANIVVIKAISLLTGEGEDLLSTRGKIIHKEKTNPSGLEVQFTHGWFGHAFQFFAEKIGAEGVAFLGPQFFLGGLLKMGGLGGNEEKIKLGLKSSGQKSEICGQAEEAEEVEGLFGGNGVGVEDNAVGAADLIAKHARFFLDQLLAGVVFQLGQLADDFKEAI